jgi:hypothetical protein
MAGHESVDRRERDAATRGPDRRRRSFWFDPRFAIGLVLIGASTAGVAAVVSAANASTEVLAARQSLVPGQRVTAGDLIATSVRAGSPETLYLRPSQLPVGGVIVNRTIDSGELVPVSAVSGAASENLTSVVIALNTDLAASISSGSRVDVWSARQVDETSFAAPTVLVSSATVVRIIDPKSIVASGTASSVELLVPKTSIASVLGAVANSAALSVVPVDLPLGR